MRAEPVWSLLNQGCRGCLWYAANTGESIRLVADENAET